MSSLFKRTFIFFTLLYILFFVKSWGSVSGNIYSHDDAVYYAQSASLVNDLDLDISNNLGPYSGIYLEKSPKTGRLMSYQPIGPSLLYAIPYALAKPAVLLFSMARKTAFDQYDPLFFVSLCFFIFLLFYCSGELLRKALGRLFGEGISDIAAIFTLWGTILPVYVFRRPIFGIIPEFLAVSLLLFLFAKIYTSVKVSRRDGALLGVVCGFLVITRWNDIYFLPLSLVFLFYPCIKKRGEGKESLSATGLFLLFLGLFALLQAEAWIKTYGHLKDFISYYYELHKQYISSKNTFALYLKNLAHVFLGFDWGVLFTMPVLGFGGAAFIIKPEFRLFKRRILNSLLFLLLFWASIHVVLQWKNTGEFYGYRFLVSLLPFSAVGFASLLRSLPHRHIKICAALVLAYCVFNFFVILPFELTGKTTLVSGTITPMGGSGWGNNAYFANAVKFYFESDFKTLLSAFSRGYLAAFIFGLASLCGADLEKFSQKVKEYFTLNSYRQYTAFIYPLLCGAWLFISNRRVWRGKRDEAD